MLKNLQVVEEIKSYIKKMGLNYLLTASYSYVLALFAKGSGHSMPVVSDGQDGGKKMIYGK